VGIPVLYFVLYIERNKTQDFPHHSQIIAIKIVVSIVSGNICTYAEKIGKMIGI
jgi:hypothetical protein